MGHSVPIVLSLFRMLPLLRHEKPWTSGRHLQWWKHRCNLPPEYSVSKTIYREFLEGRIRIRFFLLTVGFGSSFFSWRIRGSNRIRNPNSRLIYRYIILFSILIIWIKFNKKYSFCSLCLLVNNRMRHYNYSTDIFG